MAMEQYFGGEAIAQNDVSVEDKTSLEKWNSVSAAAVSTDDNPSNGFDCNICLDTVQDPVVTFCGHLYCWPCIYKWLHYQSVSTDQQEEQQQQKCPVCKAEVSQATLVPLYGPGRTTKPSRSKVAHLGIVIPRRPLGPTCGLDSPISPSAASSTRQNHHHHHHDCPPQSPLYNPQTGSNLASPTATTTNVFDPTNVMFGEMVYARMFGNPATHSNIHRNSYQLAGSSSPRVRRHVMGADKSLSRICFFFFCCIMLCLLSF